MAGDCRGCCELTVSRAMYKRSRMLSVCEPRTVCSFINGLSVSPSANEQCNSFVRAQPSTGPTGAYARVVGI
jgi:hypothetical protein